MENLFQVHFARPQLEQPPVPDDRQEDLVAILDGLGQVRLGVQAVVTDRPDVLNEVLHALAL